MASLISSQANVNQTYSAVPPHRQQEAQWETNATRWRRRAPGRPTDNAGRGANWQRHARKLLARFYKAEHKDVSWFCVATPRYTHYRMHMCIHTQEYSQPQTGSYPNAHHGGKEKVLHSRSVGTTGMRKYNPTWHWASSGALEETCMNTYFIKPKMGKTRVCFKSRSPRKGAWGLLRHVRVPGLLCMLIIRTCPIQGSSSWTLMTCTWNGNTCNVRTERNLTAKYPIIFQFIFDYICRGSFYRIASNQPLYINQILHKPFGKRSKNVLRYW